MVYTEQPNFAAALSIQSMFPVNITVAYLSEQKSIPESFVTDLRAAMSNCDTVAPIQWDRVCEDLADEFPIDCTGRRYVEQEEEATQPEEEDGESHKPPPPPKATAKQRDGTPANAKKSKAGASPSEQSPKPRSKPPPNKVPGTFAAHFTPSQQTQNGRGATGSANSEMIGDQVAQANGGQFTGKGAKPKAPGLRKPRWSDSGVCCDRCVVRFPCYTSKCRSALSLQIPLTFCAQFFLCFTKARRNFT